MKMKRIDFPADDYREKTIGIFEYQKKEDSVIGLLELLWIGIYRSPYDGLDRAKAKTLKKIIKKLRAITRFKDKDEDSRISNSGPQVLLLEDSELELFKTVLSANRFSALVTEDADLLWEVIESAQDFVPDKPKLLP